MRSVIVTNIWGSAFESVRDQIDWTFCVVGLLRSPLKPPPDPTFKQFGVKKVVPPAPHSMLFTISIVSGMNRPRSITLDCSLGAKPRTRCPIPRCPKPCVNLPNLFPFSLIGKLSYCPKIMPYIGMPVVARIVAPMNMRVVAWLYHCMVVATPAPKPAPTAFRAVPGAYTQICAQSIRVKPHVAAPRFIGSAVAASNRLVHSCPNQNLFAGVQTL